MIQTLTDPATGWQLVPLDMEVAKSASRVKRELVPDMPDRLIAATAVHLDLPLVTRDGKLRNCGLKIIW